MIYRINDVAAGPEKKKEKSCIFRGGRSITEIRIQEQSVGQVTDERRSVENKNCKTRINIIIYSE